MFEKDMLLFSIRGKKEEKEKDNKLDPFYYNEKGANVI